MSQQEGERRKKRGSEKERVLGVGRQEGLLALTGAQLALPLVLCWGNQLEKTVFSESSRIGGFNLWDGKGKAGGSRKNSQDPVPAARAQSRQTLKELVGEEGPKQLGVNSSYDLLLQCLGTSPQWWLWCDPSL